MKVLAWCLMALVGATGARAMDWDMAPPLPAPSGSVVNVSTVAALQIAVATCQSNTTIVVAAGTYNLTNSLTFNNSTTAISNVAIRGATGDPDDVQIVGRGMTNASYGGVPHGIMVYNVDGILIADLTIRDVYYHPITIQGEDGAERPHIYHCKLIDAGEQFVKGNFDQNLTNPTACDEGIMEYCYVAYTTTCRGYYTNGIDVQAGRDWICRHNTFVNIRANPTQSYMAGPTVQFWQGCRDTIVEGNTLIDCDSGICLGWEKQPLSGMVMPNHQGGIIRNNFIYQANATYPDAGIFVWYSPDTKIYHNTIYLSGGYSSAIDVRFAASSNVDVRYNIGDGIVRFRDGATGSDTGNLTNAQTSWFVNPAQGDLRLQSPGPASVVDQAQTLADVPEDYDGASRPAGAAPDIGAHEANGVSNASPVADAAWSGSGTVNNAVTLDGTGSYDPDSGPSPLSYLWAQISGPAVTLANPVAVSTTFTPTVAGTYVFRLTVDDGAATGTDDVTVDVIDPTLQVSLSSWSMSITEKSVPQSDTRQLTNGGAGTLTVSVSANQPWLSVAFDNGSGGNTLTPAATGTITATVASVSGISPGNYSATITVTGDDGSTHQVQISFSLTFTSTVPTVQNVLSAGPSVGGGGCAAASGRSTTPLAMAALLVAAACALRTARRRV